MTIDLSVEAAEFVDGQVRAGRFPSPQAAIEAAVARLRAEMLDDVDELRELVDVGLAEVDRGEFDDISVEELIAERRVAWANRPGCV